MKKSVRLKDKNPVLLGYIIASDKEDFLMRYESNQHYQDAVWNMFPDLAKRFKTVDEAFAVIALMGFQYPVYVMELYDIGKQVALLPVDDFPVPDWMEPRK